MFWGASSVTKDNCDKINKLYEEGRVFYVLGFNEPDLKEESNMSVSDALEKWKFLCQNLDSRIKLVSPAPSYPTRAWLDEFMAGVAQRGLRCDYVAVHMYAGIGTQNYQSVTATFIINSARKSGSPSSRRADDNAKNNGYNSYTESLRTRSDEGAAAGLRGDERGVPLLVVRVCFADDDRPDHLALFRRRRADHLAGRILRHARTQRRYSA